MLYVPQLYVCDSVLFMEKLRDLSHNQFIYAVFSILLEFNKKRLDFGKMVTAIATVTVTEL